MSYAIADSTTMLRRQVRHLQRYPVLTFMLILLPVVFLLLFVYVFGGTLGNGLPGATDGRTAYANYIAPGILLFSIAGGAQGTAITIATDMTEGIIDRFKTMPITRSSVLIGHVLGSLIQMLIGLAVVLGVALLVGFRPNATPVEWLAVVGLLLLMGLAFTWLTTGLGMSSKTVEAASNTPNLLMLLPFLGSGFVPTDSMPAALRWFADYQPFTPVTETLRGLLLGSGIGNQGIVAVAWCVGITVVSYFWSLRLYNKRR